MHNTSLRKHAIDNATLKKYAYVCILSVLGIWQNINNSISACFHYGQFGSSLMDKYHTGVYRPRTSISPVVDRYSNEITHDYGG